MRIALLPSSFARKREIDDILMTRLNQASQARLPSLLILLNRCELPDQQRGP